MRPPRHLAWLVLLAATAAMADSVPPQPSAGCQLPRLEHGRPLEKTLSVDGIARTFLLDVPTTLSPRHPAPLLLDFHGFGHSAAGVWKVSKFRDLAPHERFITVYPDGLPVELLGASAAGWQIMSVDRNRDLAFVRSLLDELERTYCIDRARIYATGFSNGAFLSNILGCTMADRIAAVAPVGGGRLTTPCTPSRGVPVLIHHGRRDQRIPVEQAHVERDAWVTVNQCTTQAPTDCEVHRGCRDGAVVEYCEDDSDHHWPLAATARIWKFFRAHPLAISRETNPPSAPKR